MTNYETSNYKESATPCVKNGHEFFYVDGKVHSCGTMLKENNFAKTIASINGVTLKKVDILKKIHFELYVDGELFNKFYNQREAENMFMDCADIGKAKFKKLVLA